MDEKLLAIIERADQLNLTAAHPHPTIKNYGYRKRAGVEEVNLKLRNNAIARFFITPNSMGQIGLMFLNRNEPDLVLVDLEFASSSIIWDDAQNIPAWIAFYLKNVS